MSTAQAGFSTRQIHAGSIVDAESRARVTPIYQTSGYVFDSFDEGAERFAGTSPLRAYSRTDNPTNVVAAKRIADLEGGVDGVLVGSGQAAIAMTVFSLASAGDHLLTTQLLYEGTREMLRGSLLRQGVTSTALDEHATEADWLAAVQPNTKAIYTESIPNPVGGVTDLDLLARVAKQAGVPLVVDNTVATPYLCRPFEFGADIIIHSTSKWLAGHGSVIGGAIIDGGSFDWAANAERFPQFTAPGPHGRPSAVAKCGRAAYAGLLRSSTIIEYGPTMPPTSSFLLLHGIETLSLRMQRHISNAHAVADALSRHPAVAQCASRRPGRFALPRTRRPLHAARRRIDRDDRAARRTRSRPHLSRLARPGDPDDSHRRRADARNPYGLDHPWQAHRRRSAKRSASPTRSCASRSGSRTSSDIIADLTQALARI